MLEAIGFRKEVGRVEVTFRARTKVKRAKKPETEKTKEATMAGELRGPIKPTFHFGYWGLKGEKKRSAGDHNPQTRDRDHTTYGVYGLQYTYGLSRLDIIKEMLKQKTPNNKNADLTELRDHVFFFWANDQPDKLACLYLLYGLLVFWPFRSCPCVDILVFLLDRNLTVIVEKYGSHFFFPFSRVLFQKEMINFFLSIIAGSTPASTDSLRSPYTSAIYFHAISPDARDFPRGRRVSIIASYQIGGIRSLGMLF